MFVRLQRGAIAYDLAGGDGQRSETSNFSISAEPNFQQVQYIEADQFDQFFRGGSSTTVSFSSVLTFSSLTDAENYLLNMPQGLLSQASQTVTIGRLTAAGTAQVETLVCVGTTTQAGNINWSFTSVDVTASGTTAVLSGDTPTQYAAKLATSLNANSSIAFRYIITSSGANVIITKRQAEANDATLALVTTNGTPSPNITGATSGTTASGVAPTISNSKTLSSVSCVVNLAQNGVSVLQNVTILGKY
jgi:hypothetical protein